mmetsp:Transcript_27328/g.74768  ORF Transcript_27328/g.74768 Transcript_27328/m.74768 type:complete len:221 (+) Transcript_27328:1205-1867(+)
MKQPNTSPFRVSIAIMLNRDSPDLASNACMVAPSRRRENLSQKLFAECRLGRYFCRAFISGGVNTCGTQVLSFLCVPRMKKVTLSKSTPGAMMWSAQVMRLLRLVRGSSSPSLFSVDVAVGRIASVFVVSFRNVDVIHRKQIDFERSWCSSQSLLILSKLTPFKRLVIYSRCWWVNIPSPESLARTTVNTEAIRPNTTPITIHAIHEGCNENVVDPKLME